MNNTPFVLNVVYGTVESQERMIPCHEGLTFQSRRVTRDRDGAITEISEWEPTGARIRFPAEEEKPSWWKFWLWF